MIKIRDGKKLTAKQAAAYEIRAILHSDLPCPDRYIDLEAMTGEECAEYILHVAQYEAQIIKMLGGK